ncbi:MAG: transposase [Desulfobacteraceae bacterium]|nr:transposase [Desulfobacteraceae bacterium]
MKGPKKTNRYPDEFKIKAVQLADHPDILAKDVAEDLCVHPILLYRWRKEYREGKFKEDRRKKKIQIEAKKVSELLRIQELEREINKLRVENELLKKTIEFNSEKRKMFSSS